ncbi:transcription elongation factor A TFIIS [Cryptosporidium felis]|nr:transcription elongation factor A TFIIS [Cryptosporidium felis]
MCDSNCFMDEVKSMKDSLEKLILVKESESATGEVMKILNSLDNIKMNREILKQTKIGVIMTAVKKNFCTVNNITIVSKADELIRKWKESLISKCGQESRNKQKRERTVGDDSSLVSKQMKVVETGTEMGKNQQIQLKKEESKVQGEEKVEADCNLHKAYTGPLTGDAMRDKARSFLWKAMVTGVPFSQAKLMKESQVCEIAAEIEAVLHREYIVKGENSIRDYNLQLKTIKWNLSDLKNPELNSKLYVGKITPEEIAKMQSKEMASDAKQKEREKHKQESLEACQSDWDLRNLIQKEGQFTCGKCKTNKTTYYQMQTRSADEPMTTFVRCLNCGNRWKF